jgi:hypothetical protein
VTETSQRQVTLVLCLADGRLLGRLPSLAAAEPWWQSAAPVVDAARAAFDLDVTILRLLGGRGTVGPTVGGEVTYLAEVGRVPDLKLERWDGTDPLADEPLRLPWARPGGPAVDLAWADDELRRLGTPRVGRPVQIRTWNLSSLWRLPLGTGSAWLKVVPPFFAHEGSVLQRLDGAVPRLLATEGPRVLLAEIPGEDQYLATGERLTAMVRLLVDLQLEWVDRLDELTALGAPDWRPDPLRVAATDVMSRTANELEPEDLQTLQRLLDHWDQRVAAVAECGVPDSLVHGDFSPGNVRGDDHRLVLLDWGDCGVGHPLLDQAAFLNRIPESDRSLVQAHWAEQWQHAVPGCDPNRAAALLEPVAAIRQAVIYRRFLDGIEPSERTYHADDPRHWLQRAAAIAGSGY